MKNHLHIAIWGIVLLLINSKSYSLILPPNINWYHGLGYGYNTHTDLSTAKCTRNIYQTSGKTRTVLDIYTPVDLNRLKKELYAEKDGTVKRHNFFLNKKDLQVYINSINISPLHANFLYSVKFYGPEVTATIESLNEKGIIVKSTEEENYIRNICGDHFIYKADFGGKIYFLFHFEFDSVAEKNDFILENRLKNSTFLNIIPMLKNNLSEKYKNTIMKITYFQYGGQVKELFKYLGSIHTINLLSCSLENIDKCEKFVNKFLMYITDINIGPRAQISKIATNNQESQVSYLKYYTKSYDKLVGDLLYKYKPIPLSNTIVNSRKNFFKNYNYNQFYAKKIKNLLKLSETTKEEKKILKEIKEKINYNLKSIKRDVILCFDYPDLCNYLFQDNLLLMKDYDVIYIDSFRYILSSENKKNGYIYED